MLKILMGELAPVRGIRHAHRYLVRRAGGLGEMVQMGAPGLCFGAVAA